MAKSKQGIIYTKEQIIDNNPIDCNYILGLDPSLRGTGYCVYSIRNDEFLDYGIIDNTKESNTGIRLRSIFNKLKDIKKKYPGLMVCREKMSFGFGGRSAIGDSNNSKAFGIIDLLFPNVLDVTAGDVTNAILKPLNINPKEFVHELYSNLCDREQKMLTKPKDNKYIIKIDDDIFLNILGNHFSCKFYYLKNMLKVLVFGL